MWNHGIPYVLKQLIDVISQPGLVYGFDPVTGYEGLVTRKRAAVIYTSGVYAGGPDPRFGVDFQQSYFDDWLRWAGIDDVETITFRPGMGELEPARLAANVDDLLSARGPTRRPPAIQLTPAPPAPTGRLPHVNVRLRLAGAVAGGLVRGKLALRRRYSGRVNETQLAEGLLAAVGVLRRHTRRVVGRPWRLEAVSESQRELIRHVRRNPGTAVAAAAAELGLAPNTVSALVGQLTEQGLITRTPDPSDRRVGRLDLTPEASRQVDAWRDQRAAAVAEALRRLPADERAALAAAVPALVHLGDLLRPDAPIEETA